MRAITGEQQTLLETQTSSLAVVNEREESCNEKTAFRLAAAAGLIVSLAALGATIYGAVWTNDNMYLGKNTTMVPDLIGVNLQEAHCTFESTASCPDILNNLFNPIFAQLLNITTHHSDTLKSALRFACGGLPNTTINDMTFFAPMSGICADYQPIARRGFSSRICERNSDVLLAMFQRLVQETGVKHNIMLICKEQNEGSVMNGYIVAYTLLLMAAVACGIAVLGTLSCVISPPEPRSGRRHAPSP